MPRPQKCRRVCSHPAFTSFGPQKGCSHTVTMFIDEYEAIRLIDLEGLTQEQCADQMEVARTTIQSIYASARRKLAEHIVNGCHLRIDGGYVRVCDQGERSGGKHCCRRGGNCHGSGER